MKQEHAGNPNPSNKDLKDEDIELMYRTYFRALCRYAQKIVKQIETAEDIVHDIFKTLWEKRKTIRITEKLSSYLFQSVHNKCGDFLKHERVKREHSEHIQTKYNNGDRSLIQDDNDPCTIFITQEMMSNMDKKIEELPEQCRRVFELRLEGLSYQEIAEKLSITIGSVRKQINVARRKLWK